MIVSSLIALGLAIPFLYVSVKIANEIWQLVTLLMALFCVGLSFIFSPVPIEVLIAIALLITMKTTHTLNQNN